MDYQYYLFFSITLYFLAYLSYLKLSHGLGHKAEYLQLRRFIPCAILAVLPIYLSQTSLTHPSYLISMLTGIAWIITYPALYFITYHKISSDFGFHLDTVFGLYLISWLSTLKILLWHFHIFPTITLFIVSLLEFALLMLPITQLIYYLLYGTSVNYSAISMVFETYTNEVLEFLHSLPKPAQLFAPLGTLLLLIIITYANSFAIKVQDISSVALIILILNAAFLTYYLWNTRKGVFIRTGFIELVLDVKTYLQETKKYKINLQQRLANLMVSVRNPSNSPHTIIMVIGESESRDYMHAFGYQDHNTTPWLSKMKDSKNYLLFPYTYACKDQTVPSLELALTEANQYNNKKFYESCSIVDIARKAGYKTYWFSNQSHIGSADTAVTLVANTSDLAEWTKLHLNQVQYDATLIEYLDKVNPAENNFIVLHLKGNHFNFINRYPKDFAKFSKPGNYDLIPNYLDSISYTDFVLQQITEYGQQKLNLQALVYFSDHATIPDKRRSPNFGGFATVRIPLFTYLSDEYIHNHPDIYHALKNNQNKYFTNDLVYELMCGIFDISSNHYMPENSLASSTFKYIIDDLRTDLGNLPIKNDIQ